jgi:hypothetical protein
VRVPIAEVPEAPAPPKKKGGADLLPLASLAAALFGAVS